jgi:hypothetical protein
MWGNVLGRILTSIRFDFTAVGLSQTEDLKELIETEKIKN